jgi:ABC-type nickel/cobalt efflux system permease component RcnA
MGPNSYNHYTALTVRQDSIALFHILDIAEFPTYSIIKNEISRSGSKTWTEKELAAYRDRICPVLARGLKLYVDDKQLGLKLLDCRVKILESKYAPLEPGQQRDLRAIERRKIPWYTLWIEMDLDAGFRVKPEQTHRARFEDGNFRDKLAGWKEIELLDSESAKITKGRERLNPTRSGRLDVDKLNDLTLSMDPSKMPADAEASFEFKAGAGARTGAERASRASGNLLQRAIAALPELPELLDTRYFLPAAMGLAFILGCLHALSPGHGKTLVAAYLIGSRGRVSDAIFLGFVVTVAHVFSVVILGLVILFATSNIDNRAVEVYLELCSGILIVAIGVWMFARNAAGRGPAHVHDQYGRHINPETGAVLDHGHDHGHTHDAHTHDHRHHDHSHSHEHGHDHPHDHDHAHSHGHHHHENDHDHHSHSHDHSHAPAPPDARASWWDILVLGVTGGIVPCPTALIVLFSAVALKKTGLGLSLIVVFSMGLASVLIAIGILMVKAKGFMDKRLKENGALRLLPFVSAVIITGIGAAFVLRAARVLGWL